MTDVKINHSSPCSEVSNEGETGADTIKKFCDRFGIGRTTLYEEIKSGRLVAKKCGNRTLISHAAARDWLAALPEIKARDPQRGGSER